jgi:hypothetical protein
MDWIDLVKDTDKLWDFVNMVMNIRVTQNSEKFLETLRNCQLLSGRTVLREVGLQTPPNSGVALPV